MTQKKPRGFSPGFREAAAREVVEKSRPVTDVARDCGVTSQSVRNWIKEYRTAREEPTNVTRDERQRLRELEEENRKLREQMEFLGKASAFFAARYQPPRDTN